MEYETGQTRIGIEHTNVDRIE